MSIGEFTEITKTFPNTETMPVIFIGHGSPMNGIENNKFSHAWEELGRILPRPKAILSISAHWYTKGTYVHIAEKPKTIHDFYGFPEELYEISYEAPGTPIFARGMVELIENTNVNEDLEWGIDHGTWIVLRRMYPDADIPVFQLSIDRMKEPAFHYELGKRLSALREKGILIMGSGNIVHNLQKVNFNVNAVPFEWAESFDMELKEYILKGDHKSLIEYENLGENAKLSIPTLDHYLPLLYTLGLQNSEDKVSFPVEGIALGSISMRSIMLSSKELKI